MKTDMYFTLNKYTQLVKYCIDYNIEKVLSELCINFIDNLLDEEYELTDNQISQLQCVIKNIKYYG